MLVKDICLSSEFSLLTEDIGLTNKISSMVVCDLLSHALCKAKEGDILITVQNNINSIAVGTLLDLSCIIFPDNIVVDDEILVKAKQEEIPLITSSLSAKDIVLKLAQLGVN